MFEWTAFFKHYQLDRLAFQSVQGAVGAGSTLVASLSYSRYPVCQWADLAEAARGIIITRVLQTPLPLHILLTMGDEAPWRRLQLLSNSLSSKSDLCISAEYSSSIPRPQVTYASANSIEVAIDAITRLAYKSSASLDVMIAVDMQQEHRWEPFLWKCGLCVAQFTVVEQSSVELIAAHLRVHTELRLCERCSTILPNSPLAVDAPDAQQHRCSSLIIPRNVVCASGHSNNGSSTRSGQSSAEPSSSQFQHSCEPCGVAFATAAQHQQHVKNVHKKHRFVCPECRTTFSTKGNMTTHFQRVHNQSESTTCPICGKRVSNHFSLGRHVRLVHHASGGAKRVHSSSSGEDAASSILLRSESSSRVLQPPRPQSPLLSDRRPVPVTAPGIVETSGGAARQHGYLLCMALQPSPTEEEEEDAVPHPQDPIVVADVSLEPPLPRRAKFAALASRGRQK